MSSGNSPADSFGGADFREGEDPYTSGRNTQRFQSLGILARRTDANYFAAVEARRHILGFGRLLSEAIDARGDMSPYHAFDAIRLLCNSAAMMMTAIIRGRPELATEFIERYGAGINLNYPVIDDTGRHFKASDIFMALAHKANIPDEVVAQWKTVNEIDQWILSVKAPEKPTKYASEKMDAAPSAINVDELRAYLSGLISLDASKIRIAVVYRDGSVLSGWLREIEGGFGILKRSDSTRPFEIDLAQVMTIQTTTEPRKTLFPAT